MRSARARRRDGAGRRLPALRAPARGRAARWRASSATTSAGCSSRSRAPEPRVAAFLTRLPREAPPLALVEGVEAPRRFAAVGTPGFAIVASERHGSAAAPVTPDAATCADCLRELFDPADRRHRYPFVNCTNCGPRFTIVTRRPVRPAAHDDGGLRDVRGVPGRVRRPGRPALPRAAQRLPGLRAAAFDAGRGRGRGAAERGDPRRQGARRLPPRLPGRRRGGGRAAARAQAPRGPAVRADGAGRRDRAGARRPRRRAAHLAGAADRARRGGAAQRCAPSVAPGCRASSA